MKLRMQFAMAQRQHAIRLPSIASSCWAIEAACLRSWIIETIRDPKQIDPNEYVIALLNAPSVGCDGIRERAQKYLDGFNIMLHEVRQ
jgi:hypothetical protein